MVTDIRLQHFRSYSDASFEFDKGVNIVVGPNASGKTNLLEALLVLGRGSSYRARDAGLIRFGRPWARLDGHSEMSGQRTVKIVADPPAKSYEIEGKTYKRLTLPHALPAVLFEPNHLQLLTGSPDNRREYLDDLLEQTVTGYGAVRRQYRRTLSQRNTLLKQPRQVSQERIFPWNVRLSQLAGQIVRRRLDLVERINQEIGGLYQDISRAKTKLALKYENSRPMDSYETRLLQKLETELSNDTQKGFTSAGAHRDDLTVSFNGRPAAAVASRGEIRTATLALKLCELRVIETARDKTPMLLLDDVFSELDGRRRHALIDHLARYQSFITTTDADLVVEHFGGKTNVIPLG